MNELSGKRRREEIQQISKWGTLMI